MKKYLALTLFLLLLAGSLVAYADDLIVDVSNGMIGNVDENAMEVITEDNALTVDAIDQEEIVVGGDDESLLSVDLGNESALLDLDLENAIIEADYTPNTSSEVTLGDFTYIFDDGGITLVSYNGSAAKVNVPGSVSYDGNTYKVFRIGDGAFSDNATLESVVLPTSIKSMGHRVFMNCTHLSSVTINSNLPDFSEYCIWTGQWSGGISRHDFDYSPFYCAGSYSDGLTVTFGGECTRIPSYMFATASSKSDNNYAHITKLVIGNKVMEIGTHAFYRCYDLKKIIWGKGLLTIDTYAFCHDTGLTTFKLPSRLTDINEGAFYGCENLNDIGMPNSLKNIGDRAFENCTFTKKVVLPASLLSLGHRAFKNCTHLTSLAINSNLKDFSEFCKWSGDWSGGISRHDFDYSPFYCTGTYSDELTVTFGGKCSRIPAFIFATASSNSDNNYAHITRLVIGNGVLDIGTHAFYRCYDLKQVVWGKGLLSIGTYAFCHDTGLTTFNLPSKLTDIYEGAFYGCENLNDIGMPNSLKTIGDRTFENCTFTKKVVLPASLLSLGYKAFKNCTHLSSLTINSDLKDFSEFCAWSGAWSGGSQRNDYDYSPFYCAGTYSNGMTITFGGKCTRIPAYIFATGSNKESDVYCHVKTVKIPTSVKAVGTGAFSHCFDLAKVNYAGSHDEWLLINFGDNNDSLTGASIHYGASDVSVTLNKTKATLVVGAKLTLKAKLKPSGAKTKLTWSSSNKKIATVTNKGVVKALKKGTVTITVKTANGKKASCKITVPTAPTKISFTKRSYRVKAGKKITLKTSLTPTSAKTKLTWSSSNKKIATVTSKGVVKGIKRGTVTIKVKTANGKSASVKVTVK